VRDKLTAVENELVNRDALSPDPCAEIFYWVAKSADVDANAKDERHSAAKENL
jgi:hypothetical protein